MGSGFDMELLYRLESLLCDDGGRGLDGMLIGDQTDLREGCSGGDGSSEVHIVRLCLPGNLVPGVHLR